MVTAANPKTVAEALASVDRWKADEESRQAAELVEVEQELGNLRTAIDNLQQQLDALVKFRTDLGKKSAALAGRRIEQAYAALFRTLSEQEKSLAERDRVAMEAEQARRQALERSLPDTAVGPLLQEYSQFKTQVEPTLTSLPESYRHVMLGHHQRVITQLREHVAAQLAMPVPIDAPPIALDAVYAIDAPDGTPELFVLVLPVTERVYTHWQDLPDGLQLALGARALQAIHEAARELSATIDPACGGHQGLLAIEIDLGDKGGPLASALERRLADRLRTGAPELAAANVAVTLRKVEVDFVMPPETEEVDVAG